MTGFHAHCHTSLLTRLRTHRLPGLVPAQHPETKPRLLSAQVHLNVLVLRSWINITTDNIKILLAYKIWSLKKFSFLTVSQQGFDFYLRSPQEKLSLVGQVLDRKRRREQP